MDRPETGLNEQMRAKSHRLRAMSLVPASTAVILGIGVAGCDNADNHPAEDQTLGQRVASMSTDLSVGSQGSDVTALHNYLTRFGYFPNAKLQEQYPNWRPVVPHPPAKSDTYDAQTELAVRGLQKQASITVTGVVDAPTRELMRTPRYGCPDGEHAADVDDKWALLGSIWSQSTVTWRMMNTDDVTLDEARSAARTAFSIWAAQLPQKTFTEKTSGTADIQLTFANIDGPGAILAATYSPSNGGDMTIDTSETWDASIITPAGKIDLQAVIIHELGHAFGLDHSSITSARMYPWYVEGHHWLDKDDIAGIQVAYPNWQVVSGGATDIGVGFDGTVWKIGTTKYGEGYNIARWNGTSWVDAEGAAVRIAVTSNGVPWVVDSLGNIYYRTTNLPTTGGWALVDNCARDVGAGPSGAVWKIGCSADGTNGGIFQWNGSGWVQAEGGAVRIAVGSGGTPWVVDQWGYIYYRTSNSATSGGWVNVAGLARDIGAGPNGDTWVIHTDSVSGGSSIYVLNNQDAIAGHAPAGVGWLKVAGAATQISVGPKGPWLVNSNNTIYRRP